jgi:hypothetical protein
MDELDPLARIVWKLARNHTWGQPMPEHAIIDLAAKARIAMKCGPI